MEPFPGNCSRGDRAPEKRKVGTCRRSRPAAGLALCIANRLGGITLSVVTFSTLTQLWALDSSRAVARMRVRLGYPSSRTHFHLRPWK